MGEPPSPSHREGAGGRAPELTTSAPGRHSLGGASAPKAGARERTIGAPCASGGPVCKKDFGVSQHSRKPRLPDEVINLARSMRRDPTDAEAKLWCCLRRGQLDGFRFRRQHPVGRYIPDFYCHAAKLAIELDGGQHALADGRAHDSRRDQTLVEQGIRILRFWNTDVLRNLRGVLMEIWEALHTPGPPRTERKE